VQDVACCTEAARQAAARRAGMVALQASSAERVSAPCRRVASRSKPLGRPRFTWEG